MRQEALLPTFLAVSHLQLCSRGRSAAEWMWRGESLVGGLNVRSRWRRRGGDSISGKLSLRLLPLALTAGLLGVAPIAAADPLPEEAAVPMTERGRVVAYWKDGGTAVKAAAEAALTGSDDDVRKFLGSDRLLAQVQDDQVSAAQILTLGGPSVREAARKALAGTPDALQTFLKSGWQEPLKVDQQLKAASLMNGAGSGVQAAAKAALNGTPDDIQVFLNESQYTARDADDRVKLVQILSEGGPNTQAAARLAINGSIEDVREFLTVGVHVARARDAERTSIAQLTQQAKEASAQAVRETEAAKEASAQAVAASQLAKESAAKAAAETEAARNDTNAAGMCIRDRGRPDGDEGRPQRHQLGAHRGQRGIPGVVRRRGRGTGRDGGP